MRGDSHRSEMQIFTKKQDIFYYLEFAQGCWMGDKGCLNSPSLRVQRAPEMEGAGIYLPFFFGKGDASKWYNDINDIVLSPFSFWMCFIKLHDSLKRSKFGSHRWESPNRWKQKEDFQLPNIELVVFWGPIWAMIKGPWLFRLYGGMTSYPGIWALFHKPLAGSRH